MECLACGLALSSRPASRHLASLPCTVQAHAQLLSVALQFRLTVSPRCTLVAVCVPCLCPQKRPARLCFAKQSSYELGALAYRVFTGSPVVPGQEPPTIPAVYPRQVHALLPRLVAADPGERALRAEGLIIVAASRCYSLLLPRVSFAAATCGRRVCVVSGVRAHGGEQECAVSLLLSGPWHGWGVFARVCVGVRGNPVLAPLPSLPTLPSLSPNPALPFLQLPESLCTLLWTSWRHC